MNKDVKVYVAGHGGLVGSAICRKLKAAGYDNILLRSREELDLCSQQDVNEFFAEHRPGYVFLAAARVGGIHANDVYPADFIRDNLLIQTNVIDAAYKQGASKLLFLGSSCIYPKLAPQPMQEQHLLTGSLEPTNEWYAVAKIAGIKMCQAYRKQYGFDAISLMPTNLYGAGDNFDLENSHVLPALIRKFHQAKIAHSKHVQVWGTGQARREFLHVDDLASAAVYLMNTYSGHEIVNVGTGIDVTIAEVAMLIGEIVAYKGKLTYDSSKPDGTPRKLLDVTKLSDLGWHASVELKDGLTSTYDWFVRHVDSIRA